MVLMASSQLKAEPISIIDDAGNTITLSGPVHRVISLAPALTEIIYHVGGGNRLVGTVEHSDYPAAARNIQRIGAHDRFDFETILALQPDLILAWASGNPANQLNRLEKLGLLVYRAEPGTLESLASTIQQIGKVVGNAHEGVARSQELLIKANGIKQEFSHRQNLTVFYQVWHDPIITLNGNHIVSQMLRSCGATNLFSDLPDIAPVVSLESVIKRNPEVIVVGGTPEGAPKWLKNWEAWSHITAVARGHLYSVNADLLHRHSPRIILGLRKLCETLDQARQ
tara:strand:- start:97 stop:945 length:849 start_codon:yes stop_codon:yes gene_type:complete